MNFSSVSTGFDNLPLHFAHVHRFLTSTSQICTLLRKWRKVRRCKVLRHSRETKGVGIVNDFTKGLITGIDCCGHHSGLLASIITSIKQLSYVLFDYKALINYFIILEFHQIYWRFPMYVHCILHKSGNKAIQLHKYNRFTWYVVFWKMATWSERYEPCNRMKWLRIRTSYQDIRGVTYFICLKGNELLHVTHFQHIGLYSIKKYRRALMTSLWIFKSPIILFHKERKSNSQVVTEIHSQSQSKRRMVHGR